MQKQMLDERCRKKERERETRRQGSGENHHSFHVNNRERKEHTKPTQRQTLSFLAPRGALVRALARLGAGGSFLAARERAPRLVAAGAGAGAEVEAGASSGTESVVVVVAVAAEGVVVVVVVVVVEAAAEAVVVLGFFRAPPSSAAGGACPLSMSSRDLFRGRGSPAGKFLSPIRGGKPNTRSFSIWATDFIRGRGGGMSGLLKVLFGRCQTYVFGTSTNSSPCSLSWPVWVQPSESVQGRSIVGWSRAAGLLATPLPWPCSPAARLS